MTHNTSSGGWEWIFSLNLCFTFIWRILFNSFNIATQLSFYCKTLLLQMILFWWNRYSLSPSPIDDLSYYIQTSYFRIMIYKIHCISLSRKASIQVLDYRIRTLIQSNFISLAVSKYFVRMKYMKDASFPSIHCKWPYNLLWVITQRGKLLNDRSRTDEAHVVTMDQNRVAVEERSLP